MGRGGGVGNYGILFCAGLQWSILLFVVRWCAEFDSVLEESQCLIFFSAVVSGGGGVGRDTGLFLVRTPTLSYVVCTRYARGGGIPGVVVTAR